MNTFLWITQIALALVFLAHGVVFLFPPEAVRKIKKQSPFPAALMGTIYTAEILAAFGLTLPGYTGILPSLTPLAATGLVPIMIGAVVFHLSRRETGPVLFTAVLLALSVFVVLARCFVIPL
jgi:uncharacterized membrane protein YphA (DoxX/SURF4 family)